MSTYGLILITIGYGLLYSLISVLLERILIIIGLTRGHTVGLAALILFLAFLNRVIFGNPLYWLNWLFVIIGPLIVNRYDLNKSILKG